MSARSAASRIGELPRRTGTGSPLADRHHRAFLQVECQFEPAIRGVYRGIVGRHSTRERGRLACPGKPSVGGRDARAPRGLLTFPPHSRSAVNRCRAPSFVVLSRVVNNLHDKYFSVQSDAPVTGGTTMATIAADASDVERLTRGLTRLMWVDSKRLAQILAVYDLTIPQFYTLAAISRHGQSCRMGDLAHQLFQSSATMTGIVTRLEADGLVERVMDPDDRRAVQVRVTERAKKMLDEVLAAQHESVSHTLDRMSASDRQEFLRLLDVYFDALSASFD